MKHTPHQIMLTPERYAVCVACGSIVTAATSTCPSCLGYSFERSPELVKRQAQFLVTSQRQGVQPEDLT